MRVPTHRLPDWQLSLAALVQDRLSQPFAWGERDCCLWAADAVQAVTGFDPAYAQRGKYTTALGAARILKETSLQDIAGSVFGPEINPALAQPADVGMVAEGDAFALVVNVGGAWLAQGPDGLIPVLDGAVLRAWRCTCQQP